MELFVIRLFERNATVFTAGYDRNTPLHLAALKGFTNVGKKFIQEGAFIHAKNADGKTPLEVSISHEHNDFSVMLIKTMQPGRYDVNKNPNGLNGYTLLMYSIE